MKSIKEQFDKVSIIFSNNEEMILSDIESSKFSLTFKSIYYKIKAIDELLIGLENCENNFYSSQIITRAILEHYLIGYYIYVKNKNTGTDDIGEEYYKNYFTSEFFKRKTYSIQIDNIRKGVTEKINIDTIKKRHPELDFMSQQDLQDIHSKSRQFTDIKWVGKYILDNGGDEPNLKNLHETMLEFLDRYNILSSFIHGGPSAEQKAFYPNQNIIENGVSSTKENIEWGQIASKAMKTFLTFSLCNQQPVRYKKMMKELNIASS